MDFLRVMKGPVTDGDSEPARDPPLHRVLSLVLQDTGTAVTSSRRSTVFVFGFN
jgi:hypothetical protein